MWESLVAIVRLAIFSAAHLCGGSLGGGIIFVSAALRLALLPLTLRAARETRAQSTPKLTRAGVVSALIQMPLAGALMTAVRRGLATGVPFLWIENLARPDVMLLGIVASLSVALGATTGQARVPAAALLISAAMTLVFLWSASSALTLSVGASSAVSLLQNVIVRRDQKARGEKARSA